VLKQNTAVSNLLNNIC